MASKKVVFFLFTLVMLQPALAQEAVVVLDFKAEVAVTEAQLGSTTFTAEELLVFMRQGVPGLLQDVLGSYVPVVEREQLPRVLENLEREMSDLFDAKTVVRIGGWVGA